ncbi:MAG TPA: ATP-binding protein [Streptosporangiaceae bacterium]|jgi:AAA+ ATPase superfamily predicted ATPase|nr:ATP-binding protein [Streptosporangiaceae bacterium]
MEFVGREAELDALSDWWEHAADRPALVWGRRRVGKTALIEHFASGLPRVVFHTGVGDPMPGELVRLSAGVAGAKVGGLRDMIDNPYRDWRDALDHLAELAVTEPLLLVLDEFPELLPGSPTLPGILRAFLDHTRDRTRLRILICGSSVRTMWSIQETRAPLYGRFNLTLPVFPFRPHEAAAMLPRLAPEIRALVYGIAGGMPLYLKWWREEATVQQNLLRLVGSSGSPLLTEGRLIMETEIGSEQATAALHAIAGGATRFNEIKDAVGSDPTRALDRLIEARLVERMTPVDEDPDRSRRRIYQIADNFLAFYLGPVRRHRTEIERSRGELVVPALERELNDHMGPPFEAAFREYLWRQAGSGLLGSTDIVAIGPWWRSGGQDQIDAVALAQPELTRIPVAVGEAKWARSVDAARIKAKLIAKAAALTEDVDRLTYIVCARNEITRADEDTVVVTAADIFACGSAYADIAP